MNLIKVIILCFFSLTLYAQKYTSPIRYLALGDSYTIGESVSYDERWPSILSDSLEKLGYTVDTLSYIARTGWRTDNLQNGITSKQPDSNYNLVSLLIGVNNQYQGSDFTQYKTEFPQLLNRAIAHAQQNKDQVFVVSIPDYAFTPFGGNKYKKGISDELDEYNDYAKQICDSMDIPFYNITPISRSGKTGYVARDGLHPSGKQYNDWVNYILQNRTILNTFKPNNQSNIIYPNPSTDIIKLPFYKELEIISIYDNTGRLINNIKPKKDAITHNLETGTYNVLIKLKNGDLVRKQLVVE